MITSKINSLFMMGRKYVWVLGLLVVAGLLFAAPPQAQANHCDGLSTEKAVTECELRHAQEAKATDDELGGTGIGSTNGPGDKADKTAFTFGSCGTKNVTIDCMVVEIMKFLSIAVGLAVVIGITIGGITYSTSQGNPGQAQKGMTIISNSVLGLILFLLMFAIINFFVPGGILKQ